MTLIARLTVDGLKSDLQKMVKRCYGIKRLIYATTTLKNTVTGYIYNLSKSFNNSAAFSLMAIFCAGSTLSQLRIGKLMRWFAANLS
jgi:hypothetical protein